MVIDSEIPPPSPNLTFSSLSVCVPMVIQLVFSTESGNDKINFIPFGTTARGGNGEHSHTQCFFWEGGGENNLHFSQALVF